MEGMYRMGGMDQTEYGRQKSPAHGAGTEEDWLKIRKRIWENLDLSSELPDDRLMQMIRDEVREYGRDKLLPLRDRDRIERRIFDSFRRLDVLQELLDDPGVTEVLVNGSRRVFYERKGRLYRWDRAFASDEILDNLIQTIVGSSNRSVNLSRPIVDTRLEDGSRVNIVLSPISRLGAAISIRKFPGEPMRIRDMVGKGSLSREIAEVLKVLTRSGYNLFISGGTGSGKTTFLNALSEFIPADQRVITIEDSAELQLVWTENWVSLEGRSANGSGSKEISIRDLIRTSLRMRPDRLIVGEVRGGEALDMLQAMNTGHSGSMSTGHANSVSDMLSRLETMVLMGMDIPLYAIRGQIAYGLDIMVHLGRMRDHSRKVLEVVEITGMNDRDIRLNPLYRFEEAGEKEGRIVGRWKRVGTLENTERLEAWGLTEDYRAALETEETEA